VYDSIQRNLFNKLNSDYYNDPLRIVKSFFKNFGKFFAVSHTGSPSLYSPLFFWYFFKGYMEKIIIQRAWVRNLKNIDVKILTCEWQIQPWHWVDDKDLFGVKNRGSGFGSRFRITSGE